MGIFKTNKKTSVVSQWLNKANEINASVTTRDSHILNQLKIINLDKEQLQLIGALKPMVQDNINNLVTAFYDSISKVPEVTKIIDDNSHIDRLKRTLSVHIVEMFDGKIDDEFINKRKRVAEVHYRIGLEPKWYIGSFQAMQDTLIDLICTSVDDILASKRFVQAVTKMLNFEMQLVLEAYDTKNHQEMIRQGEITKENVKKQISIISEEVATLSEETGASVEELIASSQDVNENVKRTTEKSKATKKVAIDGLERLKALQEQICAITESTTSMKEVIVKLNDSSEEIKKVVGIVQDIAEQTNLLALNSAIEAARAGEYGKGFAVVAEEVRKLADQTKSSVSEISTLINESNLYTEQVVNSITEVQVFVENGQIESRSTNDAFQNITNSIDESLGDIEYVSEKISDLVKVIVEIGSATDKVAASAENLDETVKDL